MLVNIADELRKCKHYFYILKSVDLLLDAS